MSVELPIFPPLNQTDETTSSLGFLKSLSLAIAFVVLAIVVVNVLLLPDVDAV